MENGGKNIILKEDNSEREHLLSRIEKKEKVDPSPFFQNEKEEERASRILEGMENSYQRLEHLLKVFDRINR